MAVDMPYPILPYSESLLGERRINLTTPLINPIVPLLSFVNEMA